MLARAKRFALFQAINAASSVAAEQALDALDPILRALSRRGLRRLARRAEILSTSADPMHRLRIAYLLASSEDIPDPDTDEALRRAVDKTPPPGSVGRKGPWLSSVLALLAVAIVAAAWALQKASRPFTPRETSVGNLLGETLGHYVVAVSRDDASSASTAKAALVGPSGQAALGAGVVHALGAVLDAMARVRATPNADSTARVDEFLGSISGLDKALSTANLPYFVDAEMHLGGPRPTPLLLSFYVQREARARAGSQLVRVVELWRLDTLNVAEHLLGYTRPSTPAAIVLLDQIESDLVRFTLPAAASTGRVELVDDLTRSKPEPWVTELEAAGSRAIAGYYRALEPSLSADAARIGGLLGRRRELVRKWEAGLRGQGLELRLPTRLFPDVNYTAELGLRVPRAEREEWDDILEQLRDRISSFDALRDRFAKSVARHEVQHRLDYARGIIPVPEFLCGVLGLENPLDAPQGSLAARARDEASAYLAQISRAEDAPWVDLVILSHFVVDRDAGASPYRYAALEVYAALAKALGLDVQEAFARGVTREAFARLAIRVWTLPATAVNNAAATAYQTEFGSALDRVELVLDQQNRRFRPEN